MLGFAVTPRLMAVAQRVALRHLRRQVPDPALRARLTPTYTMGCKRVLVSDDYYPALTRSNVDLVTAGIREVTATGIVTADGTHREVDAIVFGTGFHVTDAFDPLDITGRDGRMLRDVWRDGIEAYKGVAVSGFPNLFLLVGPNSGLGHNSMIFMIEAQVRYAMQALRPLLRGTSRWADVRPEVQSRYNAGLQRRLRHSVWLSGCQSWYLDARGRNTTIWPGFSWTYWLRTRRLRRAEYEVG